MYTKSICRTVAILGLSAFIAFTVVGTARVAELEAATVNVKPTGNYPEDVQNVQAAVDNPDYDVVTLEDKNAAGEPTAFNFGDGDNPEDRGWITITRDGVTITGVEGAIIYGGELPLRISASDITIQNLKFDGFKLLAIVIYKCDGTTIVSGNVISNGVEGERMGLKHLYSIQPNGMTAQGFGPLCRNIVGEIGTVRAHVSTSGSATQRQYHARE